MPLNTDAQADILKLFGIPLRPVPPIEKVIFNNPATIVLWTDGTKTVVKCGKDDKWDAEKGLAMAIVKKVYGNKGRYNNIFKEWLPKESERPLTVEALRELFEGAARKGFREDI